MELPRKCPITRGQPTSMTARSFTSRCHQTKFEAKEATENGRYVTSRGNFVLYESICLTCKGEPPPEMTIIELPAPGSIIAKEIDMTTRKKAEAPAAVVKKNRNDDEKVWQGKVDEMEMLLAQRARMIEDSDVEIGRLRQQTANLIDSLVEDYGVTDAEIKALLEV